MCPRRKATSRSPRTRPAASGRITVIAGVNGAGKSSVVGATIRDAGGLYFNPDEEAQALRAASGLAYTEANARAWQMGRQGLERAIERHEDFSFETTLGGTTITKLLQEALDEGLEVIMRYVGLDSPERHIARVAARVAHGGHAISADRIRERYRSSREHLIELLPQLSDLAVYDNSRERDPARGEAPVPAVLLEMQQGRIVGVAGKRDIPAWARPIVAAAIMSDKERQP